MFPRTLPPAPEYLGLGLEAIISSNVLLAGCGICVLGCGGRLGGDVKSIAFSLLLPGTPAMFMPDGLLPVIAVLGAYAVYG
jgi:hypothetical protein